MLRQLAALALAVTACSKGTSSTPPTMPSNKAEPPPLAAASTDVLAYLPIDSDLVMGVDWTTARNSAIYRSFEPELMASLGSDVSKVEQMCGFDPMTAFQSVSVGGKLGRRFEGVIVIRGIPGSKMLECTGKVAKDEGVTIENGVLTIDRGSTKTIATIVGESVMVMQIGEAASETMLQATLRSGAPLRSSRAFMELFDRREPNAAVWGMVSGNSQLLREAAQAGAQPKSVDGTLVLTDTFNGAVRVTFASPGEADKVKQQVMQVVPMISGNVDKVDVRVDGTILRADVRATDAQVRSIIAMLGRFI